MKRLLAYLMVACTVLLVLTGCNGSGGSSRGTPNTAYGQLVSGGSAPSNPLLASVGADVANMTISMENLNLFFESTVICGAIPAKYNYYALFCGQNANYVNTNPEMFDLSPSETVQNYVLTNAQSAGVANAKFDILTYTTQGASYLFAGQSTSKETVSGLMILPTDEFGDLIAESKIKGVVLYFHPTVLSKTGVPSGYGNVNGIDYASTFTFQFDLASIFVSNGYIVLAADYPGQGLDVNPVHPYVLLPEANALSGLNMLGAADAYLQQSYGTSLANIGTPKLYITSYSEGGGYALKAAQLVQGADANLVSNVGLTLTRTIGASGAYDLTNQMLPFGFSNTTNGLTPESNPWLVSPGCDPAISGALCDFSAGLAQSIAQYSIAQAKPPLATDMANTLVTYDYTSAAYDLVMVPDYSNQTTCLNPASLTESVFSTMKCADIPTGAPSYGTGGYYTVAQLFNPNGLDQAQIGSQLFYAAAGVSNYFIGSLPNEADLIQALNGGYVNNSIGLIIYPQLLIDPGIMALVGAANTYNWTTTTPISIIHLKYDSTVTPYNSLSACNQLSNAGISVAGSGSLTCTEIDNTQLWGNVALGEVSLPVYLDHGPAEGIIQMAAMSQINASSN